MSNIRKIGVKQWAMMVFSLSLGVSSLLIPLEDRQQTNPSFSVAANAADSEQSGIIDANQS